jgi:glycosyltransferase involved in cell wall biosynthesis
VVLENLSLVSVIIPVYNSASYLGAALISVLEQNYRPLEVIVIDDGSTDDCASVLEAVRASLPRSGGKDLSIYYSYQPNQGPAVARNRGIGLSKGDLLAFLDADDWWQPQKLQRQVDLFRQQPGLGYVISHMQVLLESGTAWPVSLNQDHYQNQPVCFLPSALLVRRDVFDQVGPFDESYRYSDDTDWFLRAKEFAIPFAVVPEVLVNKRIHETNLSRAPGMSQETLRAFHASMQRRRKSV